MRRTEPTEPTDPAGLGVHDGVRRRRAGIASGAALLGAVLLGALVVARAAGTVAPVLWVPDLLVGWTLVGAGVVAWGARPSVAAGMLLVATGVLWLIGTGPLLFLHRGTLVHLLLAFPGRRPASRVDLVAVVVAYLLAAAPPVWASDTVTLVLGTALGVVAVRGLRSDRGRRWPERFGPLGALSVATTLTLGAAARIVLPDGSAVVPALLAYEAVLCAIAVGLAVSLARPSTARVADLVVELGEERSGTLRDRLSAALGDPDLVVGHWSGSAGAFLDEDGDVVDLPAAGAARAATFVERDGAPFAVLVHDAPVLTDPALVTAVAAATRLSSAHAALQAEVGEQVRELTASRRRLLLAADRARGELEARLRRGPEERLAAVETVLRAAAATGPQPGDEHLVRALSHVGRAREDLRELARGLHPRDLAAAGLVPALTALAERAPVPVSVRVTAHRLPAELRGTVYFVCAEAVVNAVKYAGASGVAIDVTAARHALVVTVSDDGCGGADPSRGRGLRGLADRVEGLGGRLTVTSPPGRGTRLVAELPLDDEAG